MNDTAAPRLTEPSPAPEIYVDGYQTTSVNAGVAKFVFFTEAFDPVTQTAERRIVLRLTASLPTVAGMAQALGELMQRLMEAEKAAAPHGTTAPNGADEDVANGQGFR